MVAKRKRHAPAHNKGVPLGGTIKRDKYGNNNLAAWGWVGSHVSDPSHIEREHILATCGFSDQKSPPLCANSYDLVPTNDAIQHENNTTAASDDGSDVIIISDDDSPFCNKKVCRANPNCLNYLGQDVWEDEDDARELFLRASKLGENPILDARDPNLPVGLKNLGATCYANAFLQVWFRDLAFRKGVYQCQAFQGEDELFEKSPIFQLQVTFAALQESTQSVFNPTKLVESLQLRTTEQQDAQEFSKLFMSHLHAEFQKQCDPSLKSLITDQFQGQQVYGTICENPQCNYRSEHASDFLEIEINFNSDSSLEECITDLLQPEKLSGENQFSCTQCESLQDATRYTEFRQFPSVLHFSLLRFVYDYSSMERKKSKHVISFPTSIDMGRFLCAASKNNSPEGHAERNIFELRGVLLHKGPSAYHGHYEAQVFDTANDTWFQFNDESVTMIKKSVDGISDAAIDIIGDENRKKSRTYGRQKPSEARKKRRIDDSDDDIIKPTSLMKRNPKQSVSINTPSQVTSKDAYMLIYSRRQKLEDDGHSLSASSSEIPTPPARALNVVNQLNAAHDEACDKYQEREKAAQQRFGEARQSVMEIYRCWNISSPREESVVVSRQALEHWLSVESIVSALQDNGIDELCTLCGARTETDNEPSEHNCAERTEKLKHYPQVTIDSDHISCPHGRLDPQKASDMKRISQAACEMISRKTNCVFHPAYTTEDICTDCVKEIFAERLYQIEHPWLVNQFDKLCDDSQDEDHPGYWISKKWLKDWRLIRPKMHKVSKTDPTPDEGDYHYDVYCEHGELSLNQTTRRHISVKAYEIIMGLFPGWNPIRADAEPCAICETWIHASKEDKLEIRKMAEEEKAKLKHMNETSLNASMLLENVPCAILPTSFIRSWRHWLLRPTEIARPDMIDNSLFICEHDMLIFDPNNPSDLDSSICIIKRTEWDYLESLYSGGPLIALEKCVTESDIFGVFVHDIPVCVDCRLKRKSDWEITDVTLRILSANDPLTGSDGFPNVVPPENDWMSPIATRESGQRVGLRQSKRLRQVKQAGERRKMTVTKLTTIKDIKIDIQGILGVPTICQRLFYRGQELEDNAATMQSLGVLANDVIDFRELSEEDTFTDAEISPSKREEERGFGGTLLGQQPPHIAAPRSSPIPLDVTSDEKSCTACTFRNPPDAQACDMCYTPFP